MLSNCVLICCILILLIGFGYSDPSFLDSDEANSFLTPNNRVKRFLYTAREQRREAKEKYEEKCERKFLGVSLYKPRWCPPLEEWPAWNVAVMGRNRGGIYRSNSYGNVVTQPPYKPNHFGNSNWNNNGNLNIPYGQNGNSITFNNNPNVGPKFPPNQPYGQNGNSITFNNNPNHGPKFPPNPPFPFGSSNNNKQ